MKAFLTALVISICFYVFLYFVVVLENEYTNTHLDYMCIENIKHYNTATHGSNPKYKPLFDKNGSVVICFDNTFCDNGFLFGYDIYGRPIQKQDIGNICLQTKEGLK